MFWRKSASLPQPDQALPGRDTPVPVLGPHLVSGRPLEGPHGAGTSTIYLGLGCFWGAERLFWQLEGVEVTAVGYQGGYTPNPSYEEVCSGGTGHAEVVKVVYDPQKIGLDVILKVFFEEHDPTQGMRQGNDIGTQYRSAIYTTSDEQLAQAQAMHDAYDAALKARGFAAVTTEIAPAGPFFYAEDYHQQYLVKNPNGYCGLQGTGVSCAVPAA